MQYFQLKLAFPGFHLTTVLDFAGFSEGKSFLAQCFLVLEQEPGKASPSVLPINTSLEAQPCLLRAGFLISSCDQGRPSRRPLRQRPALAKQNNDLQILLFVLFSPSSFALAVNAAADRGA